MTSVLIDRLDGLSSAAAVKGPVRAATTANITLSGEQTIDGVAIVTGDRVLVKNQTAAYDNGIYVADTGTWRRSRDFSRTNDVVEGTQVLVTDGATYTTSLWCVTTANPISVGTTNITFAETIVSATELAALVAAADASADAAAASETAAATSATNAATSATNAAASEDLAEKWANEAEDVVVSGGLYSAFHWAQKAAALVTGGIAAAIHAATGKSALDDADELGLADSAASWALKKVTIANLITSIFKTTRTITNAQFASASFKLFNAAGTPRALTFVTTALTADRTVTASDENINFGHIGLKSGSSVTPSGTAVEMTGIPASVQEVSLTVVGVNFSANAVPVLRVGTSSGVVSTGYVAIGSAIASASAANATNATGFTGDSGAQDNGPCDGIIRLTRAATGSNTWVVDGNIGNGVRANIFSGSVTLSAELDRIQFTTLAGTATLSGTSLTPRWRF